jgi:acetamidase/formamidase
VCARVVGGTVATFCYLQVAAARRALKEMIDYLTTVHGISPYEAMVLCSVAADFKIAEVVDSKSSPKVTP